MCSIVFVLCGVDGRVFFFIIIPVFSSLFSTMNEGLTAYVHMCMVMCLPFVCFLLLFGGIEEKLRAMVLETVITAHICVKPLR